MEKLGYAILLLAAAAWLLLIITDMISIFPEGTVGLITLLGAGLLFVKVLKDRIAAAKTDKYSKHVDK